MSCPAELLAYRDPIVIDAFRDAWDVTAPEADALFEDLVAFLWVGQVPGAPRLTITDPLRAIDELWHVFVLHTERYAAFCQRWFGRYLHHAPTAAPVPRAGPLPPTPPDAAANSQAAFIARELGVGRLLRWYVELPQRFDDAWFRTGRKHAPMAYRPTPALVAQWRAWLRTQERPGD